MQLQLDFADMSSDGDSLWEKLDPTASSERLT
jgi:hypothetical protein